MLTGEYYLDKKKPERKQRKQYNQKRRDNRRGNQRDNYGDNRRGDGRNRRERRPRNIRYGTKFCGECRACEFWVKAKFGRYRCENSYLPFEILEFRLPLRCLS